MELRGVAQDDVPVDGLLEFDAVALENELNAALAEGRVSP